LSIDDKDKDKAALAAGIGSAGVIALGTQGAGVAAGVVAKGGAVKLAMMAGGALAGTTAGTAVVAAAPFVLAGACMYGIYRFFDD
jgi:hypothetical protein